MPCERKEKLDKLIGENYLYYELMLFTGRVDIPVVILLFF